MKYLLVNTNNLTVEKTVEEENMEGVFEQLNYAYGLNSSPLRWYTEEIYTQIKERTRFD